MDLVTAKSRLAARGELLHRKYATHLSRRTADTARSTHVHSLSYRRQGPPYRTSPKSEDPLECDFRSQGSRAVTDLAKRRTSYDCKTASCSADHAENRS